MEIAEITKSLLLSNYKARKDHYHKGNFGKVLVVAGSENYPGAGIMAAIGALRSGVGIVTLALPDVLKGLLPFNISPEIILRYFPSENGGFSFSLSQAVGLCSNYDSILVGCGWGKGQSRLECLKNISQACETSLILDADALNIIAENNAYDIEQELKREFNRIYNRDITISDPSFKKLALQGVFMPCIELFYKAPQIPKCVELFWSQVFKLIVDLGNTVWFAGGANETYINKLLGIEN